MDKSARFWDRVSRNTDERTKGYDPTADRILENTGKYLTQGDLVLDYACGTGTFACGVAGHVRQVTAIDISSGMLDRAKAKAGERGIANVQFVQSTLFDERYEPGSFDVILAFNILHLLQEAPQVTQRIHELLKPGGLLISSTPCLGGKWAPLNVLLLLLSKVGLVPHITPLKASDLESLIVNGGFEIVEAESLEHTPPNHFVVATKG
jgi:2-polyprenyl-3-methyl-5-hydroxy-6-metoxy-1,4-benzoquinol methylase